MLIQGVKSPGGVGGGGKMLFHSLNPSWKAGPRFMEWMWVFAAPWINVWEGYFGEEGVGSVPKTEWEAAEVVETLPQTHQKEGGNPRGQALILNPQTHPYLPQITGGSVCRVRIPPKGLREPLRTS